jgi:hypothetical protein
MPPYTDKPFLKLFEGFGCSFTGTGKEAKADECPFCGGTKFSLNTETGQYQCLSANKCGAKGNAYKFINWIHKTALEATTDADWQRLKAVRGLPLQTLKRHELAWYAAGRYWLIPFKSQSGDVQNLTRYWPETGNKWALPGLPLRLYGLDQLRPDANRTLFVCEGPWDAISLDHHLREKKTRDRYDILAVPSATVFKPDWLAYLKGRAIRLVFDNDKAGRDGQERINRLCREQKFNCKLSILKWPEGLPEGYDIRDAVRDGEHIADFTGKHCIKVEAQRRVILTRGDEIPERKVEWFWQRHITFGTFASLSGLMGSQKSTIARDLAARATAGLPMPHCTDGLPPFDVAIFTSEDAAATVRDIVQVHGGDISRLHVHDIASGPEPIDVLDCLEEIETLITSLGIRLVILDALNSFVGGDISTDSKARRTLSGRLQALARRTGACIIGVRNWGRMDAGSSSQRTLGATSLSDVARCVMNTLELPPFDPKDPTEPRRFQLEFEKVSDAPKPQPIPYTVNDLSTGTSDSHLRRIVWPSPDRGESAVAGLNRSAQKRVAKKGSGSAPSHLAPTAAGGTK